MDDNTDECWRQTLAALATNETRNGNVPCLNSSVSHSTKAIEKLQIKEFNRVAMAPEAPEPEDRIDDLVIRADKLIDDGQYNEAAELLILAVNLSDQHFGPVADIAITPKVLLGVSMRAMGRYKDAEDADRSVVHLRTQLYGENDPSVVKSFNNLALDLKGQRRYDEAFELQEKVMNAVVGDEGEDSVLGMRSIHNLANSYASAGKHAKAAEMHERVLELRRRVHGDDDPEVIVTMDMLGVDYMNLGDLQKAISLQREALQRSRATLGVSSDTALKCTTNLAITLGHHDGPDKGVEVLEEAYTAYLSAGVPDTPTTIAIVNGLGVAYCRVGRFQEARPLLEKCLGWNRENMGSDHPVTEASEQNYEYVLNKIGEPLREQPGK